MVCDIWHGFPWLYYSSCHSVKLSTLENSICASQNNMDGLLKKCLQLRHVLKKSLGDKYPTYMSSVRDWVRKKKTRDELDLEVSSYLQHPVQKFHSEFLLALSQLCCGRLSLRLDVLRKKPTASPGDLVDLCNNSRAGQLVVDLSNDAGAGQPDPFLLYRRVYTDRDICAVELIKARFYLAAWDRGLPGINSKVAPVLYSAMRTYIKDIIQAAILHRGVKKTDTDRISGVDIWNTVVRTNCDLPTVLCSSGLPNHFRTRDQENRPVLSSSGGSCGLGRGSSVT